MSGYETPLILSQQTSGNFPPKTEDALKSLILNFTDISFFFFFVHVFGSSKQMINAAPLVPSGADHLLRWTG